MPASPALDPSSPASERVAVVIPTLNEAESIGAVIAALPRDLVDHVIVADGGSTDGTPQIARGAGAEVIAVGPGYGRACLAGAEAAGDADILVFMDGDGADDPSAIEDMVSALRSGSYDFVIGSRTRGKREASQHGRPSNSRRHCRRRPDPAALRRALHRHGRVSRHPPRDAVSARHARNDLWLESRNADARGARRPAHYGNSG